MSVSAGAFHPSVPDPRDLEPEPAPAEPAAERGFFPERPLEPVRLDDGTYGRPEKTISPLLDRFLDRGREALLAIPGLDDAKVDALYAARDGGLIDRWGDVEALPGFDAATMKAVYRHEAEAHVQAHGLGPGSSVLFLASQPSDFGELNLQQEHERIAEQALPVVEIQDPTVGEIAGLAGTGAFKAVWAAGHGAPGILIFSGADGHGTPVRSEAFGEAVASSPHVRFVVASACSGGADSRDGKPSVVGSVAAHGPAALGYTRSVSDRAAVEMSGEVARALAEGTPLRQAIGDAYWKVFPDDLRIVLPPEDDPERDVEKRVKSVLGWQPMVRFEEPGRGGQA